MALPRVRRLRVRFGALYLKTKAAYVRRKRFAMYRCVTLNYAQISVSCSPTGSSEFTALPTPEVDPQLPLGWSWGFTPWCGKGLFRALDRETAAHSFSRSLTNRKG